MFQVAFNISYLLRSEFEEDLRIIRLDTPAGRVFKSLFIMSIQIKGGGSGHSLWKKDFELGVGGEGQDTSRHFEGSFGSICAILPIV